MPTLHSMNLPKPKNWQEFEDIVRDAQAQRWKSTGLQKNGRPGQKQHGVDIYGPDDIGRPVGIQCKRYNGSLNLKTAMTEIANAEKFQGNISALYIATTAENDSKLQQEIRILSDKRVATGEFAVALLYWDDFVGGLILNPKILSAHYPQILFTQQAAADRERLIAALEIGYYGAYLWESVQLIFGEFGLLANADPDGINVILRIVEQRASQLLAPGDSAALIESCAEVRKGCASQKLKKSDWDPVEFHAKRIQTRAKQASSLLAIDEANVLELGVALGRIYHHEDDRPGDATVASIERKVRAVLPASCAPTIDEKFKAAAKVKSGFSWAPVIFTLVDHEIRWSLEL